MTTDLLDLADAATPSRRDLVALAGRLEGLDVPGALEEASRARRDRAFSHLLVAALHAKVPLEASVLVRGAALLPDAEWLAAAAGHLTGDVARAIVAAVQGHGLGWEREPSALLVAELWCRRARVDRPPELMSEARIRGRRQLTQEGEDAVVALHALLDDPDYTALVEGLLQPDLKEAARAFTSKLVERLVGAPLEGLPERERKSSKAKGPVRRAVEKVGRNDACPCGSGKKYKACHEAIDRERNADASDVQGLTFTELSADLERHLTVDRMKVLRGHELARLDPARVLPDLRSSFVDLLGQWGEHDAALAAVRCWWPDEAERERNDDLLRLAAEHAARSGRRDVVLGAAELRGGTQDMLLEARMLAVEPPDRLAVLESAAKEQLDAGGVDLGFALFATGFPALGIHVARGELVLRERDAEADQLYAAMVEARDLLRVGPWDPIDEVVYTLEKGVNPEVDRELSSARSRMDQGEAALRATQEALERMKAELSAREVTPVAAVVVHKETEQRPTSPADDAAARELRERFERLKEELKDRHRERNALRRELEEAKDRVAELEAADEEEEDEAEEEDEDEGPQLDVSVASRVRVPRFPDDFHEKLRIVPEATARAAMMRIGELCAGIGVAFREVRPLRGFDGTWRVKVGRSYRMLFRPLDDTLEVVELLHRQDLEKRLFRLRRGGEP